MAQRAVVASGVCFAVVLMRVCRAALVALRRLGHLVRRVLIVLAVLAKRHHGRSVALQRQPQHEADQ